VTEWTKWTNRSLSLLFLLLALGCSERLPEGPSPEEVIAALEAEARAKEEYILGLTTELQEIVGYVDQLQQEEVRIAGALRTADLEVRSQDGVSNLAQQLEVLQDYQNRNAERIATLKAQIDDHEGERADWAKAERALLTQIEILNNRVHTEAERHATEIDRLQREIRGYKQ